MSYMQDVAAMMRYQKLIDKEKVRNQKHPATKLLRKRYEKNHTDEELTGPGVGSVLSVGMNKDPRKVKFEAKLREALGEVVEPKRYYHLPKLLKDDSGNVLPERRLSKLSSHSHYIEQSKRLVSDKVHGDGGGMKSGLSQIPDELQELLYQGTSEEYEGRYAYLKARRHLQKPSERVKQPVTAAQASSWELEDFQKTREWAPASITGNRGVMLRLFSQDAPTLEKSTRIIHNNVAMETILGIKVKR